MGEALEDLCTSPGRGKLQAWEDGLESHEVGMDVTHNFSLGSENMGNNSTDGEFRQLHVPGSTQWSHYDTHSDYTCV